MEQFLDAKVKRYVQSQLFACVKGIQTIIGLAGPHPEEYLKVLPKCDNTILIDKYPVSDLVRCGDLTTEFSKIFKENPQSTYLVDCDFCNTMKSSGRDLEYIYDILKQSGKVNYLSFTFSLRGVGKDITTLWLGQRFPEIGIPDILTLGRVLYNPISIIVPGMGYRQYCRRFVTDADYNNLYYYRDSGDNMISGIIKINI